MMTVFFAVRLIIFYDNTDQYEKEDVLLIKLRQMSLRVYNEKHSQSGHIMYWLISRTKQLGSLGKDQYDRDDYGNALATLSHRDEMQRLLHGESIPSDTAFIAMSLYQLDRNQEAHARLDRLRGMYEDGKHTHEERHLYQVEQLLSRDNPQVSQAWSLIESGELDKALMTLKAFDTLRDYNDPATSARMESFRKALARAYCIRGRHAQIADEYDKAINNYETAVAIHPAYVLPLHRLAWLQATCPAEEIRNSYKAIELATEACKLTKWNNTEGINVLAAAYANAGDFTAAIKWQMTAIGLLAEDGHHGVQADYAGRLCLYESGRPFRMQSQRSIVAWWKLDEIFNGKVIDSSGNGLDGKLIGDAKIAADAERGSVLSLTGDGYVDCGADIAFDITGPITVAAWTKLGAKDNQVIVVKGDTAWRLQRHQKNGVIHFGCRGLNLPNHDQTTLMGKMKLDDGTWHHIAGVFDGMKMSLYIDGDLDISAEVSGFMNINDESVTIGANPQHPGRELYGLIDDVRIYNYGLSQGEIRTLYADR
jgi:tetratricopeptide (TPR) repeat protein